MKTLNKMENEAEIGTLLGTLARHELHEHSGHFRSNS